MDISDHKLRDFYLSQKGLLRKALFEHSIHNNKMYGFTENYVKVERDFDENLVNIVRDVKLGGLNIEGTALISQ